MNELSLYDHLSHANYLHNAYNGLYRYSPSVGWLRYTGKFWEVDTGGSIDRAIQSILRERFEWLLDRIANEKEGAQSEGDGKGKKLVKAKSSVTPAMLGKCEANAGAIRGIKEIYSTFAEVATDIGIFDKQPHLLNCDNGVVNLQTGEISPHDKSQLFTYCLPTPYDPEAISQPWVNFLGSLELSHEVETFLWLVCGYAITGETREEILLYLYGVTRSGKGVLLETIAAVLNGLASGISFSTLVSDRKNDNQRFDMAPLKNKRLLVASESRKTERFNEATLKDLTGGGTVQCSFKGKTPFEYKPLYKIFLSSNHPVNADPTDTAVWGRVRLMQFHKSHLGSENKMLKAQLLEPENMVGILAWLVAGANQWYADGLPNPAEMQELKTAQKLAANSAAEFAAQFCKIMPGEFTRSSDLYDAYKRYCNDELGQMPMGGPKFRETMKELGYVKPEYPVRVGGGTSEKRERGYINMLFDEFNPAGEPPLG